MQALSKQQEATVLKAETLLASGNAKAAAEVISLVAQQRPDFTRAQVIFARALRDIEQTDLALARFKLAAESSRDSALWTELVTELLKAGQKSRARSMAKKAPIKGPAKKALVDLAKTGLKASGLAGGGVPDAELQKVKHLLASGQVNAAAEKAKTLLERHPDSAFLCNILGICSLNNQDAERAEKHFKATLELSPDFTGALSNLGLSLTMQGKFGEAIRILRQAVSKEPASVNARTNLANAYLKAEDFVQAEEHASRVLKAAPSDVECLQIQSTALMKSHLYEEAIAPLQKLLELLPKDTTTVAYLIKALESTNQDNAAVAFARDHKETSPDIARRYATLLIQLGQIEEARSELEQVLKDDPENFMAYLYYGALQKWSVEDPLYSQLCDFVRGKDHHPRGIAFYALSKAEVDFGNFKEGMRLLHLANKEQAKVAPYDHEKTAGEFAQIKSNWSLEVYTNLAGVGVESVAPIFIIGMPRSGSTLTEQIIAAHPDITGTGEDSVVSPFFPPDIAGEPNVILEAAQKAAGALRSAVGSQKRVVDKYLNNSLRLGALAAAFPNAVFVETERDPRAIALSIYSNAMRVAGHPYSTDLANIAALFKLHSDLMQHWKKVLGDRLIVVSYETLVADPEPSIRALIERVGLPWDDVCLRPEQVSRRIKTLSYAQVRADIGTASAAKWKKFETDLEPFSEVLRNAGLLPND